MVGTPVGLHQYGSKDCCGATHPYAAYYPRPCHFSLQAWVAQLVVHWPAVCRVADSIPTEDASIIREGNIVYTLHRLRETLSPGRHVSRFGST